MALIDFFRKNKIQKKEFIIEESVSDETVGSNGIDEFQRELIRLFKADQFEEAILTLASASFENISYDRLMEIGEYLISGGYLNDALDVFSAARGKIDSAEAVDSVAKCLLTLNRAKDAAETILSSESAEQAQCLATLLHAHVVLGEMKKAKNVLMRIADNGAASTEIFFFVAHHLFSQNLFEDTIVVLERAIDDGLVSESIYLLAANAYEATEDIDEADYCFATATEDFGESKDSVHEYANFLFRTGRCEQAKALMISLLGKHPKDFSLLNDLGSGLFSHGDTEEALAYFEECVQLFPNSSVALNNLSVILRESGEFNHAQLIASKAILASENSLVRDVQNNIDKEVIEINQAMINFDLGQNKDIEKLLTCRLKKNPDDHRVGWYRCLSRLVLGNFEGGWSDYEYRWKAENVRERPFRFSRWRGEAIEKNKKLLVFGEQGLGDEIMFASCVNELIQDEKIVMLECHPKLEKIFARSFPTVIVVGKSQLDSIDWVDEYTDVAYKVPIGDLPQYYRLRREDFYNKAPYLVVDNSRVDYWKVALDKLGGGKKIGISWRGGSKNTRTNLRSISLEELKPLFELENVEWVSVQYGEVDEELKEFGLEQGTTIHHFSEAIADYDETASLISALDCIVSVQTAIVHLAGALAVETHCLLPVVPEWRYRMGDYGQEGNKKMLWYDSVNLYPQPEKGDWLSVVNCIRTKLVDSD